MSIYFLQPIHCILFFCCVCICVYVCVHGREREREMERQSLIRTQERSSPSGCILKQWAEQQLCAVGHSPPQALTLMPIPANPTCAKAAPGRWQQSVELGLHCKNCTKNYIVLTPSKWLLHQCLYSKLQLTCPNWFLKAAWKICKSYGYFTRSQKSEVIWGNWNEFSQLMAKEAASAGKALEVDY